MVEPRVKWIKNERPNITYWIMGQKSLLICIFPTIWIHWISLRKITKCYEQYILIMFLKSDYELYLSGLGIFKPYSSQVPISLGYKENPQFFYDNSCDISLSPFTILAMTLLMYSALILSYESCRMERHTLRYGLIPVEKA